MRWSRPARRSTIAVFLIAHLIAVFLIAHLIEWGNVMTEGTPIGTKAMSGMHDLSDVASLVEIQPEATVSRTVLQAEGARVVLFSFDAGQVLTEHTAAVPALLQVLGGHLRITADGRTVDLRPGGLVHLAARLPHAVEAVEASRLQLTMLDPRVST